MRPSLMRVRLISFGPWKALFPKGGREVELAAGEPVRGLLAVLAEEGIRGLPSAAVAVNQEYASRDQVLQDGDEVAILPPVSGGMSDGAAWQIAIVTERIDAERLLAALKDGSDGAVCVFDGIVRNNTRGRETLHLDYEAFEPMALKEMQTLRAQAIERFGVRDVALVHRLGRLVVGETSVWIGVASAHRGAAFEACRWVIDTLKKTVPIWKREQFADGAMWADGEPFPDALVEAAK